MRRYSDDQLLEAIEHSHSWRGVLRSVGLRGDSAGSMRAARRRADELGFDYSHFTGQRRWSDGQLGSAVAQAGSWTQVADSLGLRSASGATLTTIRGHAARLKLRTEHLEPRPVAPSPDSRRTPDVAYLSRAGTVMAAAWFELCGIPVSWPLEPARYDLVVWPDCGPERIQVKTTRQRSQSGWTVRLATSRKVVHTYGPDEIDKFFIITGDLTKYLIPLEVVGGLKDISLSAYAGYRVRDLGSDDLRRPNQAALG